MTSKMRKREREVGGPANLPAASTNTKYTVGGGPTKAAVAPSAFLVLELWPQLSLVLPPAPHALP